MGVLDNRGILKQSSRIATVFFFIVRKRFRLSIIQRVFPTRILVSVSVRPISAFEIAINSTLIQMFRYFSAENCSNTKIEHLSADNIMDRTIATDFL